jgi:K+/H+ antiporter YhaU regulatory subunit KhtT
MCFRHRYPARFTIICSQFGKAAYMYFEKESRRRHRRSELLTRDEARRIAAIFAKLPELLKRS